MNHALMLEVVRTLRNFTPIANIDKMLDDHAVDASGHCPLCRSRGCTLYAAARQARHVLRAAR